MKKFQVTHEGQGVPRTSGAGVVAWTFASVAGAMLVGVISLFL
jgi:hypothetical protein